MRWDENEMLLNEIINLILHCSSCSGVMLTGKLSGDPVRTPCIDCSKLTSSVHNASNKHIDKY